MSSSNALDEVDWEASTKQLPRRSLGFLCPPPPAAICTQTTAATGKTKERYGGSENDRVEKVEEQSKTSSVASDVLLQCYLRGLDWETSTGKLQRRSLGFLSSPRYSQSQRRQRQWTRRKNEIWRQREQRKRSMERRKKKRNRSSR